MKFNIPFNNPRGALVAIAIFVSLFLLLRCHEARAETLAEVGVGVLGGDLSGGTMILLTERFDGKYDVGLGLMSRQQFGAQHIPNNMVMRVARVVRWGRLEASLGVGVWANSTRVVSQEETFDLGLAWRLNERQRIHVRHWSNAGQQETNLGQDYLGYSYSFR